MRRNSAALESPQPFGEAPESYSRQNEDPAGQQLLRSFGLEGVNLEEVPTDSDEAEVGGVELDEDSDEPTEPEGSTSVWAVNKPEKSANKPESRRRIAPNARVMNLYFNLPGQLPFRRGVSAGAFGKLKPDVRLLLSVGQSNAPSFQALRNWTPEKKYEYVIGLMNKGIKSDAKLTSAKVDELVNAALEVGHIQESEIGYVLTRAGAVEIIRRTPSGRLGKWAVEDAADYERDRKEKSKLTPNTDDEQKQG